MVQSCRKSSRQGCVWKSTGPVVAKHTFFSALPSAFTVQLSMKSLYLIRKKLSKCMIRPLHTKGECDSGHSSISGGISQSAFANIYNFSLSHLSLDAARIKTMMKWNTKLPGFSEPQACRPGKCIFLMQVKSIILTWECYLSRSYFLDTNSHHCCFKAVRYIHQCQGDSVLKRDATFNLVFFSKNGCAISQR